MLFTSCPDHVLLQARVKAMKESQAAAEKAEAEAKEARAKIVAEAQEYRERVRREEAFERELARVAVRCNPLGKDRHHNRYFWHPSLKGMILVESPDGKFSRLKRKDELDALLQALNPKGIRELALKGNLEKKYKRIANSLQRSMTEAATHHVKSALRQSGRRGAHQTPTKSTPDNDEDLAAVSQQTVDQIELMMEVLHNSGRSVDGGWKNWIRNLRRSKDEQSIVTSALIELEEGLFEFSEQPVDTSKPEEPKEEVKEDEGSGDDKEEGDAMEEDNAEPDSPQEQGHGEDLTTGVHEVMDSEMHSWRLELQGELGKLRDNALWRTSDERQRWIKEVSEAADCRATLYYTLVLLDRAEGVLQELYPKFSLTKKRAHKTEKTDKQPKNTPLTTRRP